jgi:hypothetical protein
MLTKIMKLASVAALVLAAFFWSWSTNFQIVVQFLVCGAAGLVVLQAARTGKHLWAAAFALVVVLFNPLAPVPLSGSLFILVDLICMTLFLASAAYLQTSPRLTIASTINPGPEVNRCKMRRLCRQRGPVASATRMLFQPIVGSLTGFNRVGFSSSGIGFARKRWRHGLAIHRAQRVACCRRALSVAMPVLAYM